jgi:hypothetical protein
MKLTTEERYIKQAVAQRRIYPRWRPSSIGGFLLWTSPNEWGEEVFHRLDGTWQSGRKSEGTERVFTSLWKAMQYAEALNMRTEFQDLKERYQTSAKQLRVAGVELEEALA